MSRSRLLRRRPRLTLAVAGALLVAGVSVGIIGHAGAGEDRCDEFRDAADHRRAMVADVTDAPAAAPRILVIGDSYSVGLGVTPQQSWPARLPGQVLVDGFSGSGFSRHASECGDVSYASRAAAALRRADQPGAVDLVVVEGGLNDFDQPLTEVESGVRRLFAVLEGRDVLVVGPAPAPSRDGRMPEIDLLLRGLATEYGARYLSMLDERYPYLEDDLHLTPEGHREFGDRVAAELAQ